MSWIVTQSRKKLWSPYAAALILALAFLVAVIGSDQTLGASGAIENIAGMGLSAASPALVDNMYFKYVMPPGFTWQVWLLLGTVIGGFISAKLSGDFKTRWVPDVQWEKVFGPQRWKRWLIAFLGGVILEYGAGIAGGCTSGLAISGGVQLAPAAFLFIFGMFASGMLTAWILYRRNF